MASTTTAARSQSNASRSNRIRVTVVGDAVVGKTVMVMRMIGQPYDDRYVPTIVESSFRPMKHLDKTYNVELMDTAGQEEYDRLRLLAYPETKVFLLCFSLIDHNSFKNVKSAWIPEVKSKTNAPIILVGMKKDLCKDAAARKISANEAQQLATEIGAVAYKECSGLTTEGIEDLFHSAFHVVVPAVQGGSEKKSKCHIL